ncbi:hypothetical protein [Dysgonomonas gadei]|uniref:hypothetical protein n=1 Tax=Dysgonomonas gadei TaxID=156974 RepID=UPI0005C44B5B|nr:hypothetical protein [Dysgonomonas gadei]
MKYASARAVSFKDGVPVGLKDEKNGNVFELILRFGLYDLSSEFFRFVFLSVTGRSLMRGAKAFLVPFGDLAKRNTSNFNCA